jgi:Na/Pi-cotransporter
MNASTILPALAGFGLLLFALRQLTSALDATVSRKLRPWLARVSARRWSAATLGFLTTVFVQASSVTVIGAMGLLNRNLIPLESGILIMLGAALGSTMKAWFFTSYGAALGPVFIGVGSLAFFFVRTHWRRKLLESMIAIGLTFLGLSLLDQGLAPLANAQSVQPFFVSLNAETISAELLGMLIGFVLTVAVQSSSTVLIIIIALVSQGHLSLPAGAAMVLGANIGTTSTAILMSYEQSDDARRLAFGHFIVKLAGSAFALLFFRSTLMAIDSAMPGAEPGGKIAAFHTAFNLVNGIFWAGALPVLAKLLRTLIGSKRVSPTVPFPGVIQKLLARIPERAVAECESQLKEGVRTLWGVNELYFACLSRTAPTNERRALLEKARFKARGFLSVQEGTNQMLQRLLNDSRLEPKLEARAFSLIRLSLTLERFSRILNDLGNKIELEVIEDDVRFTRDTGRHLEEMRLELSALWENLYSSSLDSGLGRSQSFEELQIEQSPHRILAFELAERLRILKTELLKRRASVEKPVEKKEGAAISSPLSVN